MKNIIVKTGLLGFLFLAFGFSYNYYQIFYSKNTNFPDDIVYLYISTGSGFDNLKSNISPYLKDTISFFKAAKKKEYINIKPGKYAIKKDYSNNDIITSLRSNNIPIKVIFNNVERLEDLATKISNLIESDSLALMNSFIDDKFLKENSLTKESVFAIFTVDYNQFVTYSCEKC